MNKIAFNFYVNKAFRKAKRLAQQNQQHYAVVNLHGFVGVMRKSYVEETDQSNLVIREVWP